MRLSALEFTRPASTACCRCVELFHRSDRDIGAEDV